MKPLIRGPRITCHRLSLIFFTLVIVSCSGPAPKPEPLLVDGTSAPPEQVRKEEPTADSSPSETPQPATTPRFTLEEIPTREVVLDRRPSQLPFTPGGLRFQMSSAFSSARTLKPIGGAAWGPNGHLYLTFPKQRTVVRFSVPRYDLTFFGSGSYGGKGESITRPDRLDWFDGLAHLTDDQKGQTLIYSPDFALQTVYQSAGVPPVPGPQNQYLLRADDRPDMFFRVDEHNKPVQAYSVPAMPNETIEGRKLVFDPLPNWQIVAGKRNAHAVYRYEPKGRVEIIYNLDLSFFFGDAASQVSLGARLHDLAFRDDMYWLLLDHENQRSDNLSYMMVFGQASELLGFWEIPLDADVFDMNDSMLVFANRELGQALTYNRRNNTP
ncbi:hypothetical protein SCOR_26460 [Sulfidibacter corallicola]|uniref:Uncharacterized protein n=1 Tax=Sulfidibacter corallicola TaxID=2818388 RepID=A0A8A4TSP3_SULCO|nr:hypothetical protein [Sulfidibacter corallicola]QTD52061.1 hypothetical protein J3U87_06270 [Sulfidibacter corallicola]